MNSGFEDFSIKAALVLSLLIGGAQLANARGRIFMLTDAVRMASTIFVGDISAIGKDEFTVTSIQKIKGEVSDAQRVRWIIPESFERRRPRLKSGDRVFVFGDRQNSTIVPYGGVGVKAIKKNEELDYLTTVKAMISYLAESNPESKAAIISQLLDAGPVAQQTALRTIYLDAPRLATASLMPKVVALAQSPNSDIAVPAIQIVGQNGTKDDLSVLAKLKGSPNRVIAEAASNVAEDMKKRNRGADGEKNSNEKKHQLQY